MRCAQNNHGLIACLTAVLLFLSQSRALSAQRAVRAHTWDGAAHVSFQAHLFHGREHRNERCKPQGFRAPRRIFCCSLLCPPSVPFCLHCLAPLKPLKNAIIAGQSAAARPMVRARCTCRLTRCHILGGARPGQQHLVQLDRAFQVGAFPIALPLFVLHVNAGWS